MSDSLFHWTGHPFVDAGLAALLLLSGKNDPEALSENDIRNAISFASEIYSQKTWASNYLHGMIFPNSGILMVNPGIRGIISKTVKESLKKEGSFPLSSDSVETLRDKLKKNFDDVLADELVAYLIRLGKEYDEKNLSEEEIKEISSKILTQKFTNDAIKRRIENELNKLYSEAKNISSQNNNHGETCVICGRSPPTSNYKVYMSSFPLLGSGKKANYFHSGNLNGVDICAHCLFLVQFMPLASYRIGWVLIMQGFPYELNLELSKEAVEYVRIHKSASNGENFKRPENFLFKKITEITRHIAGGYNYWRNSSISLYYFISNNQGQKVDIINVPTTSLIFAAFASLYDRKGWKKIVSLGWRKKPSTDEEFSEMEKGVKNKVYDKLLNGESILYYFIDFDLRSPNTKWELLEFYALEVLDMDKKALDLIKKVGDNIVETISVLEDNKLGKRLRELEKATKLYQFEEFFVNLEKLRQRMGMKDSLMTFDDFSSLLVNYGEDLEVSWRTVKNLLLFRIYETLHDRLAKIATEEENNEGGDEE